MRTAKEMYEYCEKNKYGRGFNKSNSLKHFGIIEKNLWQNEEVIFAFTGLHNYQSSTRHDNNFAYAITTKNRILLAQKKIIGEVFQAILIENLNDVTLNTGMLMGILTIDTIKEKFNVALNKNEAKNINDMIHSTIQSLKNKTNENIINPQIKKSVVDELKGLKELLDCGILSEDEFRIQKEKILNK